MSNANTLSVLQFTRPFAPAECARILGDGTLSGNAFSTQLSGQMFDRVSCTTGNSTTVTDRTLTLSMTKLSSSP
jgi:hypothetical protein